MDINQMLPLLLKGKLGDREQTLLKLTQNPDPSALGSIITQMYEQQQKAPRTDLYATLKKIIPAQTLGLIIKYFDAQNRRDKRR
ncbi:hypothetical protein [Anaerocaecibacter muris]|uniref:hypothetical protein n=1 Tax=Anaerocaecibacter muris TaxID=2941513 RepID=UPI00203FE902|nr:hypothetical protein [Anaerocaecibacter muris]